MRTRYCTLLTAVVLTVGCSSGSLPEPSRAHRVRAECPPHTDNTFYFHPDEIDGQRVEYASYFLAQVNAPSLSCGSAADEGYRITRLAPGRPSAVIEILHAQDGWTLHGVEFPSAVYGQRATITNEARKNLTDTQVANIRAQFDETHFWRTEPMPHFEGPYDGPWVTLEARHGSSYHVVFPLAWSFGTVTATLFDMAGLATE